MSLSDILTRAETGGLVSLKLPELRQVAAAQGLKGLSGLRKGDLIAAIETAGGRQNSQQQQQPEHSEQQQPEQREQQQQPEHREQRAEEESRPQRQHRRDAEESASEKNDEGRRDNNDNRDNDRDNNGEQNNRRNRRNRRNRGRNRNQRGERNDNQRNDERHDNQRNDERPDNRHEERQNQNLTPVAGILDFVDANTAFIRTTGYHAGTTDVYVPINLVRKFGMRHGDAIVGSIRPGGGDNRNNNNNNNRNNRGRNRQKYTPLHAVETVNGLSPAEAAQRPNFSKLTPLYPNQRLRLETDPKTLTTRVIDLVMPIGKGQRALIVSPPKAGKTTIMQDIANAIAINNPECYLMVVLVDERPEEVTDMQRSVKGEVIASTFDRPPGEHTAVAELAVERAKRLVEQGKDVVLLLDSITRLGRAYNNSSPASGRILSGGVDSNALYPPKKFLGAARNIENGGSLTIIATAMVETGSAGDTVIFEEFKGTGNAELKLDRKISERRVFPAVDINPSGTRKDELLLGPDEARILHKLRRILSALDSQAAIDLLIKQLRKNKTNREFMLQIASSAPLAGEDEDE
ncbi:transcription termination factor Rho [uncultured Corynebacterium sp.]|uniref:transcription termination factor Rho n=1 Tax=uncultured Corynebacterium sp. TaxID=159447 RepID=UPI002596DC6C|nr:transcription termination factor Rho [uncultured Corynebacterium sp.]